jgi:YD repeat-containing protein
MTQGAAGIRLLKYKDGSLWRFDSAGRLISQADRNGNTLTLQRDSAVRVLQITEPAGRSLVIEILGTGYSTPERTDRAYFTKSGIE